MSLGLELRKILIEKARNIQSKNVAVFLSSGVDSQSILFSLLETNKNVTTYTFHLNGVNSTDLIYAKKCAETFGVNHIPIPLPLSIKQLKSDIVYMTKQLHVKGKSNIECTWPMLYAIKRCKELDIATGACSDGHFVLSKKGILHYSQTIIKMNEFKQKLFNNPNYAQIQTLSNFAKIYKKRMYPFYYSREVVNLFMNKSWAELNKPRQKQPILDAFPEYFKKVKQFKHTNLQLGDSGISDHFLKLLRSDWNINNWKSPVGIYNAVYNGRLK